MGDEAGTPEFARAQIVIKTRRFIENVVHRLEKEYGSPRLGNPHDPLDDLIFILLSEKTDGAKHVAAYKTLKAHFPRWEGLLSADVSQIETLIRSAGMGQRRAQLLQRMCRAIIQQFGDLDLSGLSAMSPEDAEAKLVHLPGVGRKAARCVLLYCFGSPILPVDVHTYRLAMRVGILSRRVSYDQSHAVLPELIPRNLRRSFHVNAVAHGRARCFAQHPKCEDCGLTNFCAHPKAARPLQIEVRPRPLAIDLFAGAGGLSLGFNNAGFQVVQVVENNPHAAATYRHNHPQVDVLEEDIGSLDPLTCLRRLGLRPGDVTALIGGPPCQGFSESNRRTRTLANPKNHLYKAFIRFLNTIKPTWFVLENVAGLRTLSRGAILRRIVRACCELGYKVEWTELNAADYGVPQLRRRLFIVGNRLGVPIRFPKPTHGCGLEPYVSVRAAISDLPSLENGASDDNVSYEKGAHRLTLYQKTMRGSVDDRSYVQGNLVSRNAATIIRRYTHIRPGQNWEAIPPQLLQNYSDVSRSHTGIYYRLEWNKPAKVIGNFRKNMLIHPEQNRGLSVREAARLQSFSDDYVFLGSIGFQQQLVADAVPPLLAETVANCIRAVERKERVKFSGR